MPNQRELETQGTTGTERDIYHKRKLRRVAWKWALNAALLMGVAGSQGPRGTVPTVALVSAPLCRRRIQLRPGRPQREDPMGMPDVRWSFDVRGLLTARIKQPLSRDPLRTLPLSRPPCNGWTRRVLVILTIPLLWATLLRVGLQQGQHARTPEALAVRLQSTLRTREAAGAAEPQAVHRRRRKLHLDRPQREDPLGMADSQWSFDVSWLLTVCIKKPLSQDQLWTLPLSRPPCNGWAWRRLVMLAIPSLWATLLRVGPQQGCHARAQGKLAARLRSNLRRRDARGAAETQCGGAGACVKTPFGPPRAG